MNIAITAHDSKKELLSRLCSAYSGILKDHSLFCTGQTGKIVSESTGINVYSFMNGTQGGQQQLASKISCNEIDLVISFQNPFSMDGFNFSFHPDLVRLCDIHSIPIATNIATAEALLLSLSRGDLDWRMFVNRD